MNTTPSPRPVPSPVPAPPGPRWTLRRGLGAAGAAVVVAFVGTAGLGAATAHAAGIEGGLRNLAEPTTSPSGRHGHPPRPAAHPANLPAATATAYRYSVNDGELIRL